MAPAVLAKKDFNDYVMEVVDSYPTDGSYPYDWTSEDGYYGITKDLHYNDQVFVKGDKKNRSYCSGITFEVFIQAYQAYNQDLGVDGIKGIDTIEDLENLRVMWYGADGDKTTIKHALEETGLGYELKDRLAVKKGDFVQLWRHSGSGHTAVFINWVQDKDNQIIGFKYWSSNYKKGISYGTEYFGDSGSTIIKDQTYFMRVIEPMKLK